MKKFFTLAAVALTASWSLSAADSSLEPSSLYPEPGVFDITEMGQPLEYVNLSFGSIGGSIGVDAQKPIAFVNTATDQTISCTAEYNSFLSSLDGVATVHVEPASPINVNGTYNLVIPEGAFYLASGAVNAALSYEYVVTGAPEIAEGDIELEWSDPSDGSSIAGFNDEQSITLKFKNPNALITMTMVMWNVTLNEYVNSFSEACCKKNEDGTFSFTNITGLNWPMYIDNEYTMTFNCYHSLADCHMMTNETVITLHFKGTAGGQFIPSSAAITAIDPVPGSAISAEANVIELSFDAAVSSITGFATTGGQIPVQSTIEAQPKQGENAAWLVTIPESFLSQNFGSFMLILSIADEFGHNVVKSEVEGVDLQYNSFTGFSDQVSFAYECYSAGITVDVTPAAGEVTSLKNFTFTNPDASSLNAIGWGNVSAYPLVVEDAEGNVVAQGADYSQAAPVDEHVTAIYMTLDTEIDTEGTYTLVIPQQAITLGEEFTAVGYKGQRVEYTVKPASGIESVAVGASSFDVYNLQGMRVLRSATDTSTLAPGIYIVNGKKIRIR